MLSKEDNELLTRVGPGTPMGELMRRYWHPVGGSVELDENPFRTKEVRLLGEDLVLFRDRSGQLGLIERFCAHRRVNLAIGVVEQDGLRCQYHGWKFDRSGRCIEQPFEDTVHPDNDGKFKEHCSLQGYAVQELAGLVFAYLGPQPAPELPRWEPLTWERAVRDIAVTELPCNWLQCQENSLDPVHTEWLHNYFGNYAAEILGLNTGRIGGTSGRAHTQIAFDPFEHGVVKRRMVEGDTGDEEDWKVGHPILFPNILVTGNQYGYTMQFRVPVDDTTTYHVSQYIYPPAPGASAPAQPFVPVRKVPLRENEKQWVLNYVFNQDYMAWITQGPIAKRDLEKLGESDRGIILFRRMLKDQARLVQDGGEPMNVFRDPAENQAITFPMERVKHGVSQAPKYRPGEAGESLHADLIKEALATWSAVEAPAASNGHANGQTNGVAKTAVGARG